MTYPTGVRMTFAIHPDPCYNGKQGRRDYETLRHIPAFGNACLALSYSDPYPACQAKGRWQGQALTLRMA